MPSAMSNRISLETYAEADDMFLAGASIRQVCAKLAIARETAHKIQKFGHLGDLEITGKTRVNTGRRKDGSLSYYETREPRDYWRAQHYGDEEEFR